MSDDERLMHHEYDGIQEYDNPLPFWWKGIFVLTIAFSAAYGYWYHLGGPGPTIQQEYAADLKEWQAKKASVVEDVVVDETLLATKAADPEAVSHGKAVFEKNCASCHTAEGKGLVGANLTDRFQIHGTTRMDIYQTIYNGVTEKGMLSWGPVLPPDDLIAAAAFVTTLRGTDVPGGKAHEGKPVEPFKNP